MSEAQACVSCGFELTGKYCPTCGEKRPSHHDYSVPHFFENVFETFAHFDFKSLRAFKILLLKPGMLTRHYLDGRRKPYVGPVQLFVIANVVFALFGPNSFRTPLAVQLNDPPFVTVKQAKVEEQIAHRFMTREAFAHDFDSTASLQAKTWIFSMIPMFALCLAVIYGFRRYVFEHLVFSTHFYAFTLIWMLAAGAVLRWSFLLAGVRLTAQEFDNVVSLIILAGLAVYLFAALRRTYGGRVILGLVRSLALVVLFFPILLVYRFLLFFVTLKAMH